MRIWRRWYFWGRPGPARKTKHPLLWFLYFLYILR